MLSGAKEDLGALAMLIDSALDFLTLTDWVYESCGSVSFTSLEHPKFIAFLNQVGLPTISRRELTGARLDAKFEEAKVESEVRIKDALFFQIAPVCRDSCGQVQGQGFEKLGDLKSRDEAGDDGVLDGDGSELDCADQHDRQGAE
ncbi:hypothetical protein K1719_006178 [Acacia pycnantha]|nr:hypothetical protein K1719_006178 [Acacia pycnantha]